MAAGGMPGCKQKRTRELIQLTQLLAGWLRTTSALLAADNFCTANTNPIKRMLFYIWSVERAHSLPVLIPCGARCGYPTAPLNLHSFACAHTRRRRCRRCCRICRNVRCCLRWAQPSVLPLRIVCISTPIGRILCSLPQQSYYMQSLVAQYAQPERRARGQHDRPFIIGRAIDELAHQSIHFLIDEDLPNWWGLHLKSNGCSGPQTFGTQTLKLLIAFVLELVKMAVRFSSFEISSKHKN